AIGADILTIKEAVEFDRHVSHEDDLLITSCCCPMWVGMIRKVYGEFVKDVSPSVSPMIAVGRIIKKFKPNTKVVFVGPCAAKKSEARDAGIEGAIDYVLTFQEVQEMLNIQNINPIELKPLISMDYASKGGRLYGKTSGVSQAVAEAIEEMFPEKYDIFKPVQANGIKECKEMLTNLREGKVKATFVEGMGCAGGCVGGPKAIIPVEKATELLTKTANQSAVKVTVNSDVMMQLLKKLGVDSLDDFMDPDKIKILERTF
ncbi:MAG: [Fe-Fe] hydrogenase large subunit C-terminal domain-containing protein, partial [Lachnospirales bacterium]